MAKKGAGTPPPPPAHPYFHWHIYMCPCKFGVPRGATAPFWGITFSHEIFSEKKFGAWKNFWTAAQKHHFWAISVTWLFFIAKRSRNFTVFGTFSTRYAVAPLQCRKVPKNCFFEAVLKEFFVSKNKFEKNIGTELNFLSLLKNAPFFRISMTWEKVMPQKGAVPPWVPQICLGP